MGGYVPNTKEQRQDMLKAIGLSSMEDLFVDIPQEVRLKGELETVSYTHLTLPTIA